MSFKPKFAILGVLVTLAACSSIQKGEEATVSTSGNPLLQLLNDRPGVESVAIGDPDTDMAFNAVASIYNKAMKLADSYVQKTELSKYSQLTELSAKDPVAYKVGFAQLSEMEKAEYGQYLNSTSDMTAQALTLLVEAYKLQESVRAIDITKLISNPMKLPAVAEGTNRATDQIQFAVDALSTLKKYHGIYSNAKNAAGQ